MTVSLPSSDNPQLNSASIGLVVTCSRRSATVLFPNQKVIKGKISPKVTALVVGDWVQTEDRNEHLWITQVCPRRNCLSRSYASKTREIAANLDRVYVVNAPDGLFNTEFADRVLSTCCCQSIPICMILNKSDLDLGESQDTLNIYSQLGFATIKTSTKSPSGLTELKSLLDQDTDRIVALVGMSGVGKSSILNQLVSSASRTTQVLSHKTGKGQQTTSQAEGFVYQRAQKDPLLIIDLPGIQNFGTSTLPLAAIADSFPEFMRLKAACEFSDCRHLEEPNCAVKQALEAGTLAISRYQSYISILQEIESFKPY